MLAPDDIRCVVFDIGETLVDESRMWALMADRAGVPRFTVMGMLGAVIERGEDHRAVWPLLGVPAPAPIAGLVAILARGEDIARSEARR